MDKNHGDKSPLLSENKIVNIEILRKYLDNLNLHQSEFQMNKFVVKQKKLKNIKNVENENSRKLSSGSNLQKKSFYDSYKQVLMEEKQNDKYPYIRNSFYKSKESNVFNKAYHKFDSSFNTELKQEDLLNRVNEY